MAIGSYTKTTYVDGSAPAINANNLNNAENQIKELSDAAVSGGASPTKIWTNANDGTGSGLDADKVDNIEGTAFWYSSSGTGGSDGNGGQPPAPKPQLASTTAGFFTVYDLSINGSVSIPAGGSWAWFATGGTVTSPAGGASTGRYIDAGGAVLSAASASLRIVLWRIS